MCKWRDNLLKYARAITKSFLGFVLTTGFSASILFENSLMHLSTKSCRKLFLYKILFNLSISWWNLIKSENKLKHRNNDLIKCIKLFGINPTEGLFSIDLVANFSFSQKMLISEKGKHSSFSIEKFMLACVDDKYCWNLSAWLREENSANISST